MPTYRCNGCGGDYADPLEDGTFYFHACPPLQADLGQPARRRPGHRDERVVGEVSHVEDGVVRDTRHSLQEGAGRTELRR